MNLMMHLSKFQSKRNDILGGDSSANLSSRPKTWKSRQKPAQKTDFCMVPTGGTGWPSQPADMLRQVGMFGPRWRMNSGPMDLISGCFVGAHGSFEPLEMSSIGPLFILQRGPNMRFWLITLWSGYCPPIIHHSQKSTRWDVSD